MFRLLFIFIFRGYRHCRRPRGVRRFEIASSSNDPGRWDGVPKGLPQHVVIETARRIDFAEVCRWNDTTSRMRGAEVFMVARKGDVLPMDFVLLVLLTRN